MNPGSERYRRLPFLHLRDGLRPPMAHKRLSITSNEKVRLEFGKPACAGQRKIALSTGWSVSSVWPAPRHGD
jgi:hypothetical protein